MKKFSLEYSYAVDDEQVFYRRTFGSFSSLRDYIVSEFGTFTNVESFDVHTFDTEFVNHLPTLF